MLKVTNDLSSYTLAAGEPFVLEVQLLDSAGRGTDINDEAMFLTFYSGASRAIVRDFAGDLAQYDGDRYSDTTGEFFRWAFDGRFSEAMFKQSGVRVELTRRLKNGREIVATGALVVMTSAISIPSLADALIADTAIRVTIKAAAMLGLPPTLSIATVAFDGSVTIPAPVFTVAPSIAGTPQVGQALSALTFNDGTVTGGTISARAYLLAGVSKALSYVLQQADLGAALVFQNAATGAGSLTTVAASAAVTVAAAPTPSMSFGNATATVAEGNSGTKTVTNTVTVIRNGVSGPLTIALAYGGTANSSDFTGPVSGTIAAGSSTLVFDVTINGDTTAEPDETIIITASLVGYTGVTAQKTITITNDDTATKYGQIGYNTTDDNGQDGSTYLFLNRAKTISNNGPWSQASGLSQYGFPTGIESGKSGATGYVGIRRPASGTIRYVVKHNGSADINITFALASTVTLVDGSNPNRKIWDFGPAPAGESNPLLVMSAGTTYPDFRPNNPAGSREGIEIYELSLESRVQAGELFYPEATAVKQNRWGERPMDIAKTNNSLAVTVADKTPVGYSAYSKAAPWGVPLEILIAQANATKCAFWYCIPPRANDAYLQWIAETIRDQLDPTLPCIIEYGNEVWNTADAFVQTYTYVTNFAKTINSAWGANEGYGYLATKMVEKFKAVFGAAFSSRVFPALARQGGVRSTMDGAVTGIEYLGYKARDMFAGVATGFYFGGPIQELNSALVEAAKPGASSATIQAANDAKTLLGNLVTAFETNGVVSQQLLDHLRYGNVIAGLSNFNVLELDGLSTWTVGSNFAREQGIKHHWGYEGQNFHTNLELFNENNLGTRANVMMEAAHNDLRVSGLTGDTFMLRQFKLMRQAGMSVAMVLTDTGFNSKYGAWLTFKDFFSANTNQYAFYSSYLKNPVDPITFELNMLGGDTNLQATKAAERVFASFGGITPAGPVTLVSGTIPAGMTFANGKLSGAPTTAGSSGPLVFQAIDGAGSVVQKSVTFTIAAAPVAGPKYDHVTIKITRNCDQTDQSAPFPSMYEFILYNENNALIPITGWTGDAQGSYPLTNLSDGSDSTRWYGNNYPSPGPYPILAATIGSSSISAFQIRAEGIRSPGDFVVKGYVGVPPADGSGGTVLKTVTGLQAADWNNGGTPIGKTYTV